MSYRNSCLSIVIIMMFSLFSCAGLQPKPLRSTFMVPTFLCQPSNKSISIGKIKGKPKREEMLYKVTADELWQPIVSGLRQSKLFSHVYAKGQGNADYTLTAHILGQPVLTGSAVTVAFYVRYTVFHNESKTIVFNERVQGTYTDTEGGMLAVTDKMRRATERAIRENIKNLIEKLSKEL